MGHDKGAPGRLELNNLVLEPTKQEVTVCGKTYHLTPKETRLLATFMQHPDEILTREFLMQKVWETDWSGDCATLEVHVCWLRSKIEDDSSTPQLILTVRGVGYMFVRD